MSTAIVPQSSGILAPLADVAEQTQSYVQQSRHPTPGAPTPVLAAHFIRPYFTSLLYITLPVENREGVLRRLLAASAVIFLRMTEVASAVI